MMKKLYKQTLSIFVISAMFLGIVSNFIFTNASEIISYPVEIESKRSEYAKHYLNTDGTYTAIINTNPIHYLNNNTWQEIDNTLTLKDGKYINQGNALNVGFSTQTSVKSLTQINNEPMIDIDYRDFSISWDMVSVNNQNIVSEEMSQLAILPEETTDISLNSQAIEAIISEDFQKLDSKAKYSSIYDGIDLEFEILPATIKETIIIDSREDIIDKFAYYIVADGLSLSLTENGTIEFSDSEGSLVFVMPKAFMFDSSDNPEYNYDIVTTLEEYSQGYLITFSPDSGWLNAVEREYPVKIDPTLSLNTSIGATYVDEANPTQNFYTSPLYYVQGSDFPKKEAFITAPSSVSSFNTFEEVTTAYCHAKINSQVSGTCINIKMINSRFMLGTICYDSAQTAGFTTTINDNFSVPSTLQQNDFLDINITPIVQSWTNYSKSGQKVGTGNNGLSLSHYAANNNISFFNPSFSSNAFYYEVNYETGSNYGLLYNPSKYDSDFDTMTNAGGNIHDINFQRRMNCYGYALQVYYKGSFPFDAVYWSTGYQYYCQTPGEFGIGRFNNIYATTYLGPNGNPKIDYDALGIDISNYSDLDEISDQFDNANQYTQEQFLDFIEDRMCEDAANIGYSISSINMVNGSFNYNPNTERIIAMVGGVSNSGRAYHYYLRHSDGTWSHKNAYARVSNRSLTGNVALTDSNILTAGKQSYYSSGSMRFYKITKNANVYAYAHDNGHTAISTGTSF